MNKKKKNMFSSKSSRGRRRYPTVKRGNDKRRKDWKEKEEEEEEEDVKPMKPLHKVLPFSHQHDFELQPTIDARLTILQSIAKRRKRVDYSHPEEQTQDEKREAR